MVASYATKNTCQIPTCSFSSSPIETRFYGTWVKTTKQQMCIYAFECHRHLLCMCPCFYVLCSSLHKYHNGRFSAFCADTFPDWHLWSDIIKVSVFMMGVCLIDCIQACVCAFVHACVWEREIYNFTNKLFTKTHCSSLNSSSRFWTTTT